jgi:mono/diheme cytochrome c family protein
VEGAGGLAPALNNREFLRAATDGFLQATIARGRRGTAMRAWAASGFGFAELTPLEINDIVAYIRSWQSGEIK